ncbi:thiamine diphosphokinase [Yoonia sediminilitoris]|uniref:Thiamine diphosphokinase n=1 Tax=Yoonia sediminilitoris TaxID=1286148 RepID=A0A2T6KEW9_9RHOB|nr:thiamine diphosphokinase [Yoonia sediminilitoris]PUB13668.1 thiamine diphosphokinase [Yoonia sediminilitoris]RCW94838.1 thiamine diphosphokinase [Yoonia sediminilitoris]
MIVSSNGIVGLIGGAAVNPEQMKSVLSFFDNYIAVDGGADHCLRAGLRPAAVVGDMDSLSQQARATFSEILCHISEQDTTDFEKAIARVSAAAVLAMGFTGGRLDHLLSVLNVLGRNRTRRILLLDEADISFLTPPEGVSLALPAGTRIGLMPLDDVTVTARGLTWPITAARMHPTGMVSSSNQVKDPLVEISAKGPLVITLPPTQLGAVLKAVVPAQ